ncbi:putative ATP-binding protein involved in virulence [Sphingomonas sp. PP-F2F-A104-K0414]|uniref:AAA family ATPase n=1 Tax=Sphingomonas sp. PP-F2F-A104-K0414 TaxID=2135661 RepID=UPI00104BC821|nr:AAA family ATPase [Sphingomonas sp. PP-F2F-A104-K0414]TCP99121.1 putative ATP-binding protein involved in virulence [Sphingomonas sp. PP-F2F-A104-K0414]
MTPFAIKQITLKDIGPFDELELDLPVEPGITLICGDNGIGKSTILETLAFSFSPSGNQRLKKKAGSDTGSLGIVVSNGGNILQQVATINSFGPDETTYSHVFPSFSKFVINVRTARDFSYIRRDALTRDPSADDYTASVRVASGIDGHEIKAWYSNRFLLAPHSVQGGWTDAMKENLQAATSYFAILDPSVSLSSVDVATFDIMVKTPSGIIPFEYLSSGFRSAYILLLGILKEIEFRGIGVSASEFAGIILIDEIDLHLHPTWQRKIAKVLRAAFPLAQIIATTHSPHVIQTAMASEVCALVRGEDGVVSKRHLPSAKYGFMGWTLDEVLEDVMGVPDTKSSAYRLAVEDFDRAISSDDPNAAILALEVLREMLHPGNPYRKLIEIEASTIIGNVG